jgi:hypothetical protein
MTQEEKELLLKDLCARLPYHPILNWKFSNNTSKDGELKTLSDLDIWWITEAKDCEVKPYLRPMSSMTVEEQYEYNTAIDNDIEPERIVDWYNLHHFDYRKLIEKGLALEAPKGMYKTE